MTSATFRRELIEKIRALGAAPRGGRVPPRLCAARRCAGDAPARAARSSGSASPAHRRRRADRRTSSCGRFPSTPPRVLLIGASTGGPQALDQAGIAARRRDRSRAGADHAAHAADLHHHSGRASARAPARSPCARRSTASRSLAGTIYLAPGGRHMTVARRDGTPVIALDDGPPVQFLQARGRSAVRLGRRGLGRLESGA